MIFFDSDKQSIEILQEGSEAGRRWRIDYDQGELARFSKGDSTLSPFLFLHEMAKLDSKSDTTLYVLVAKNFIFMAIFKDGVPVFWKIVPNGSVKLHEQIAKALKEYYALPDADFITALKVYTIDQDIDADQIQKELLIQTDLSSVPKELERIRIAQIEIPPPKERTYLRNLFLASAAIILIVMLIKFFLAQQNAQLEKEISNFVKEQVALGNENNKNQALLMKLRKFRPTIERLEESNSIVQNRIKEVFDLIPDQTYLQKALFDKGSLVLEGVTSNKAEIKNVVDKSLAQKFDRHKIVFNKRKKRSTRFRLIYKEKK